MKVNEKDYTPLCMLEMWLTIPWVRKANTELINDALMTDL